MFALRLLKIVAVVLRHRLDRLIPRQRIHWSIRLPVAVLRLLPAPRKPLAVSFRRALEDLGPVFVKFGQLLSTRRDLFDDDFADELQKLQDQVPPFSGQVACALIEAELEAPVSSLFRDFDVTPLASASVAQIHPATMADGTEVVVKVIRPGVQRVIGNDLRLLYLLAGLLQRLWPEARRLRPLDVVGDYDRIINNELDLQLEAANASKLRANWLGSGKLYVPWVDWELTRRNVMVMERIHGLPAKDIPYLREQGVDLQRLGTLGVEIFFTQVFEHNFFHADMHPGNVFVDISRPQQPTYIGLDCAIVGSLREQDQSYLARNLLAFFRRDYHEVARLHVDSGWVPVDTNVHEFEQVIRSVCEPVFQKPIREISFGRFLLQLFQTARRFDMQVQPQLILLQKTLLNIEGLGREIYPDLDLWETAKPFMERWARQRVGPLGLVRRTLRESPYLLEALPTLPGLAWSALREASQLSATQRSQTAAIEALRQELARTARRARHARGAVFGMAALACFLFADTDLAAGVPVMLLQFAAAALALLSVWNLFGR